MHKDGAVHDSSHAGDQMKAVYDLTMHVHQLKTVVVFVYRHQTPEFEAALTRMDEVLLELTVPNPTIAHMAISTSPPA